MSANGTDATAGRVADAASGEKLGVLSMKVRVADEAADVTGTSEEPLADAASRMRFNDVGTLAVIDAGRLIGILTERDLTRALADGVDPRVTTVADYMTPEPPFACASTEPSESVRTMTSHGLRHLPMVEEGRVVGLVSLRVALAGLLID